MEQAGLTRPRLTTAILLAGIAGFAGLYLASIGPYWNISPDSASYVGWGRSLAAGAGWGSPPINPPLTAFVFAAVLRVFPTGYLALNALTPLLIFLSLGFAYRLLERRGGRNVALLAVLLSLAATPLYRSSTQLLSEPAYLVLSMAALCLLDGFPLRSNGADPGTEEAGPRPLHAWLGGILLVATALTRTIGIALALAVLLVQAIGWLRRRQRPRLVLTAFALASLASVVLWQAYSGTSYAGGWFRMFVLQDPWTPGAGSLSATGLLDRGRDNIGLLPRPGGMLLNGWATDHHTLDLLLQTAGTLAIVWGLLLSVRRRAGVTELYLGLYAVVVTAHMLVGGDGEYRFLVPVAPLLFYYALVAARHAGQSLATARRPVPTLLSTGLGALFLFGYLRIGWDRATRGVAEAHYSPFADYPIKRPENFDAERLALWLKQHSKPDDRYAAAQRDMFDVLSERRGEDILLSHTQPHEALVARLLRGGVRYLLVDHSGPALGDSLLAVVRAYPERFRLIWKLPAASLYEVKP